MLWVSGDTVLYDGVREVADRLQVDTALLHLGGVRFGVSGPVRYTMTARDAVELCGLVRPRTAIPIHYEGWKHFREGREAIEREWAAAPRGHPRAPAVAAHRSWGAAGGVRPPRRAAGYGARVGRLFVTGLGGYLGSELGRQAPAAGWEVAGIAGSAELDVRDGVAVRAAVARRPPGRRRPHRLSHGRRERQRRGHACGRRRGGRRRCAPGPPLQRHRLLAAARRAR